MPWLHLVFDAYEDYKRLRARGDRRTSEAAERAAQTLVEFDELSDDDGDDHHRKDKKKKKHRDKDKD